MNRSEAQSFSLFPIPLKEAATPFMSFCVTLLPSPVTAGTHTDVCFVSVFSVFVCELPFSDPTLSLLPKLMPDVSDEKLLAARSRAARPLFSPTNPPTVVDPEAEVDSEEPTPLGSVLPPPPPPLLALTLLALTPLLLVAADTTDSSLTT
jgi:hypothetical protein